jgi:hypothetical protein
MEMKKKMKGISRIDSPKCHGWFVRIYRDGRTIVAKLFSDQKYGGKTAARLLAVKYKRQKDASLPPSKRLSHLTPPFFLDGKVTKSNKTGVNGVCFVYERKNRKQIVVGFAVNYKLQGKQHNKKFSFSRYGSKRATLKMAVAFRRRMERVMLREWKKAQR